MRPNCIKVRVLGTSKMPYVASFPPVNELYLSHLNSLVQHPRIPVRKLDGGVQLAQIYR